MTEAGPGRSLGVGGAPEPDYNPPMARSVLLISLAAALVLAGCRSRDVRTDLRIADLRTGFYDLGVTANGENKLVPSVAFRLENVSEEAISGVQINAVFMNVGEDLIVDEHFVPGIGSSTPLEAGDRSAPIVLRSEYGYTSTESRMAMLKHKDFVDFRVRILGRHGRNNWTEMGVYVVARELLTE